MLKIFKLANRLTYLEKDQITVHRALKPENLAHVNCHGK